MEALSERIPVVLEIDSDEIIVDKAADTTYEEYKYEELPDSHCFRLFELLPGIGTASLQGLISLESLDNEQLPYFRALSYTWAESRYDNLVIADRKVTNFPGPREKYSIRHPVWINGSRLLISTNLRDALRRFRDPDQPIHLMPKIYHKVAMVHFWLGEEDEASQIALTWIASCYELASKAKSGISVGMEPKEIESLAIVLPRSGFRRIWTIQELANCQYHVSGGKAYHIFEGEEKRLVHMVGVITLFSLAQANQLDREFLTYLRAVKCNSKCN